MSSYIKDERSFELLVTVTAPPPVAPPPVAPPLSIYQSGNVERFRLQVTAELQLRRFPVTNV